MELPDRFHTLFYSVLMLYFKCYCKSSLCHQASENMLHAESDAAGHFELLSLQSIRLADHVFDDDVKDFSDELQYSRIFHGSFV